MLPQIWIPTAPAQQAGTEAAASADVTIDDMLKRESSGVLDAAARTGKEPTIHGSGVPTVSSTTSNAATDSVLACASDSEHSYVNASRLDQAQLLASLAVSDRPLQVSAPAQPNSGIGGPCLHLSNMQTALSWR